MTFAAPTGRTQLLTALAAALGMAVTVGAALGFQHIGGYIPCKLCLGQRTPYYVGVPLMALAALAAALKAPAIVTRGLLAAGGLLMLYGAYLGGFHSGVEWGWWQGPTDCAIVDTPPPASGGNGILDVLDDYVPPSCTEASWRFLGLSFAGWNVVASLGLAAIALFGALRRAD